MKQSNICPALTQNNKIIVLAPNDDKLKKTVNIILRKEKYSVSLINSISEIPRHVQHHEGQEDETCLLLCILPINDQKSVEALAMIQKNAPKLHALIIYDCLDDTRIQKIKHGLKCTFLERTFDAGVLVETISTVLKNTQEQMV